MLQFFRHQSKRIMLALAVIISVSFIFWGSSTNPDFGPSGPSADDTMMTVLGSDYNLAEFGRLQRGFQIAEELRLPGWQSYFAYEIVDLKFSYGGEGGMPLMVADAPIDYAANLVVLRDALERNGIRASDEEVQQVFRNLGQFMVNGQFDRDRGIEYERSLSERGIKLSDVYDVIRDSIGLQKLAGVVSGNLVANPKVASEFYALNYQTIKAANIPFALEDFKKNVKVTDEEIGKYFEENKENYRSPEKRAISYVLVENPNTEGKNAEDTVKITTEHHKKLGDLSLAVISPNADFDAEVKKAGFAMQTVPAFSREAPPEPFKEESDLVRAIFLNNPETHPASDPVQVKKGYVIFKVTKIENPAPQELKDVKDKVRDTLAEQKAMEAMQKAANDAKAKLETAIKGGKSLDVAAKEAGLAPQMLPEFSPANPLTELSNGRDIVREAMITPAGSFTKPLPTENGVLLVHVLSKELRKSEDSASAKKGMAESVDERMQTDLFRSWFERRYEEAHVKFAPYLLTSSPSIR